MRKNKSKQLNTFEYFDAERLLREGTLKGLIVEATNEEAVPAILSYISSADKQIEKLNAMFEAMEAAGKDVDNLKGLVQQLEGKLSELSQATFGMNEPSTLLGKLASIKDKTDFLDGGKRKKMDEALAISEFTVEFSTMLVTIVQRILSASGNGKRGVAASAVVQATKPMLANLVKKHKLNINVTNATLQIGKAFALDDDQAERQKEIQLLKSFMKALSGAKDVPKPEVPESSTGQEGGPGRSEEREGGRYRRTQFPARPGSAGSRAGRNPGMDDATVGDAPGPETAPASARNPDEFVLSTASLRGRLKRAGLTDEGDLDDAIDHIESVLDDAMGDGPINLRVEAAIRAKRESNIVERMLRTTSLRGLLMESLDKLVEARNALGVLFNIPGLFFNYDLDPSSNAIKTTFEGDRGSYHYDDIKTDKSELSRLSSKYFGEKKEESFQYFDKMAASIKKMFNDLTDRSSFTKDKISPFFQDMPENSGNDITDVFALISKILPKDSENTKEQVFESIKNYVLNNVQEKFEANKNDLKTYFNVTEGSDASPAPETSTSSEDGSSPSTASSEPDSTAPSPSGSSDSSDSTPAPSDLGSFAGIAGAAPTTPTAGGSGGSGGSGGFGGFGSSPSSGSSIPSSTSAPSSAGGSVPTTTSSGSAAPDDSKKVTKIPMKDKFGAYLKDELGYEQDKPETKKIIRAAMNGIAQQARRQGHGKSIQLESRMAEETRLICERWNRLAGLPIEEE